MKKNIWISLITILGIAIIVIIFLVCSIDNNSKTIILLGSLSFFVLCFIIVLISLFFSEFKKESMWNKVEYEAINEIIKQKEINNNLLINEYRDLRKQKFKIILEIRKMLNNRENLRKEIEALRKTLTTDIKIEERKNIVETIKQKQIELHENLIIVHDYKNYSKEIIDGLVELRNELNSNDVQNQKKADKNC